VKPKASQVFFLSKQEDFPYL